VKVLWTDSALAQLQAIHDYLAQTSPEYALRIVDRLTKRSIQIARFPFSGRMVPEFELNEVREVGGGNAALNEKSQGITSSSKAKRDRQSPTNSPHPERQ